MGQGAALVAAGGSLYMMYVRVVDPYALFSLFEIDVKVTMITLIGGIGTNYGPLLGSLLLILLEKFCVQNSDRPSRVLMVLTACPSILVG